MSIKTLSLNSQEVIVGQKIFGDLHVTSQRSHIHDVTFHVIWAILLNVYSMKIILQILLVGCWWSTSGREREDTTLCVFRKENVLNICCASRQRYCIWKIRNCLVTRKTKMLECLGLSFFSFSFLFFLSRRDRSKGTWTKHCVGGKRWRGRSKIGSIKNKTHAWPQCL